MLLAEPFFPFSLCVLSVSFWPSVKVAGETLPCYESRNRPLSTHTVSVRRKNVRPQCDYDNAPSLFVRSFRGRRREAAHKDGRRQAPSILFRSMGSGTFAIGISRE